MNSKEIMEQRAALIAKQNELNKKVHEEKRTFTPEEKELWDKLDSEQNELWERADTQRRVEKTQAILVPEIREQRIDRKQTVTKRDHDLALRAWALSASGNDHLVKENWRDAAERTGLNYRNSMIEFRAQTDATSAEGGYATNDALVQGIEQTMVTYGGMRQASKVIKTSNGSPLRWVTNDDSTSAATIVAENTTFSNVAMTFGAVELGSYKYVTSVLAVSLELLQDSEIDLSGFIAESLGARIGRLQNTHFTTGDGTSKPDGVAKDCVKGADADGTADITYDDLVDLFHSVDPAYRQNGVWMFNDTTFATIRKIVDLNNLPLWGMGLNGPESNTLLGKPIIVNNDVADIANNAKSVLFGDFSKYIIRDVIGTSVRVLNERYAELGSVAFLAYARADGALTNTSAVKHLLH